MKSNIKAKLIKPLGAFLTVSLTGSAPSFAESPAPVDAPVAKPDKSSATLNFRNALSKLMKNSKYRSEVSKDGTVLKKDFKLDDDQIQLLQDVWLAAEGPNAGGRDTCGGNFSCCCCCC